MWISIFVLLIYLILSAHGSIESPAVEEENTDKDLDNNQWWQVHSSDVPADNKQIQSVLQHSDLFLRRLPDGTGATSVHSCYDYKTTKTISITKTNGSSRGSSRDSVSSPTSAPTSILSRKKEKKKEENNNNIEHEGQFCYPAIIITGVRKSGTSVAYSIIRAHPNIVVSGVAYKENCAFIAHESIIQYFRSLPTPYQLETVGQSTGTGTGMGTSDILLDACPDLSGNMLMHSLLRRPSSLYILLLRNYSDWAWGAYNFWIRCFSSRNSSGGSGSGSGSSNSSGKIEGMEEEDEDGCEEGGTRWAVPGLHKRSAEHFHSIVNFSYNAAVAAALLSTSQTKTETDTHSHTYTYTETNWEKEAMFSPCITAMSFYKHYLTHLWAHVPPQSTYVLTQESLMQQPMLQWEYIEEAIGFIGKQTLKSQLYIQSDRTTASASKKRKGSRVEKFEIFENIIQSTAHVYVDARQVGGSIMGAVETRNPLFSVTGVMNGEENRGKRRYSISGHVPLQNNTRLLLDKCWIGHISSNAKKHEDQGEKGGGDCAISAMAANWNGYQCVNTQVQDPGSDASSSSAVAVAVAVAEKGEPVTPSQLRVQLLQNITLLHSNRRGKRTRTETSTSIGSTGVYSGILQRKINSLKCSQITKYRYKSNNKNKETNKDKNKDNSNGHSSSRNKSNVMNLIEFEPILILCGNYLRSGVTAMLQGLQAGWGVASEHIRSPPSLSSLSSQSSYIHDSTSTSIFIDASVSANDIDMGLQRCPSVDNPFFFAHPSDVQEHGGQANTQGWQQKTKQSQKPESVRLLPRASACINADGSYIQISDIFEDTGTGTKAETTTTAAAGVFRKTVLFVDDPLVVLWASVGARSCAHHQKNYVSESNTVETRRGEEAGGRVVGGAEEYSHCVMQQRWDAWDRFLLTPPSVFSDSDTAVSSDWNLKTAAVAIAKLAPISVPIAVGIKIVSYQALLTLPITATAAGQKRGKRQGHELTSVASMEDVMQYLSIGTNIDKDADIITDIRDKAHCALAFIAAYRREETATGTNTDTVSSTLKQRKRTENRKGSRTGSKRFLRGHNYVPTTTSRFLLPFATSTSTSTWTTIHLPSLFLSDMLIHYAYSNPNAACAARGYLQDLISNASGDNVGIVVPPLSASVPYICTGDENRRGFGQGNVNNSSAESKAVLWDMQDQVLDQEQEQEHEKWRIQHRCHTRYAGKTYRPLSTALLQWSASHPPPILVSALTEEQEQWLGQGQAIANMRTIIEVASGLLTGSTTAISDNGSGSRFLADGYCGVRQIVIASPSSSSSSTEAGIGTGVGVRTVDVAFTLKTDISSSTPSLPLAVMHLTKTARRKCMRGSIRVFDKAIVLVADPFLSIYRAFFYSHDQHTYHSNKHVDQEKDWATFARKSASNLNITALLSVSDNGGSNSNIHGINEEIASSRNVLLVTPQALMWAGAEVGSIVKDKTKDKDKDRDQNQEKARRILQVLSFIEGERDITSGSSNSSSNSSSMDRAICASQWLPLSSTSVFSTPSDTDIDIHLEKEYQAMSTAMHAVSGLICAIHRALPANMITMLDREGWQGECDM